MRITKIWFEDGRIWGQTDDGRLLWQSLLYYKRLRTATEDERNSYQISGFGIHWPTLDEDVSFESFEYPNPEPNGISRAFLTNPEINASAVARNLGIKQSLLAAYICGTKQPSPQRERQITDELKRIGQKLVDL